MESQIDEKLILEKQILDKKREYKLVLSQVEDAKREYNSIMGAIDRNTKVLDEQKAVLKETTEEISLLRLNWATEKADEWDKIERKLSEAENVLKRKAELNTQEQTLRDIEQKNTDILNETRRLELKVRDDIVMAENEKNRAKTFLTEAEKIAKEAEKERELFKEKISNLLKDFNG